MRTFKLPLASLFWAAIALLAVPLRADVRLTCEHAAVLSGGAGAVVCALENTTGKPASLSLKTSAYEDATTQALQPSVKTVFSLSGGGGKLPARLNPGPAILVQANVSGIAGSSLGSIRVFNNGVAVGGVEAVAGDASLNIAMDGYGGADKPLAYSYGAKPALVLKNGDALAYRVQWRFELGTNSQTGTVLLAANSSSVLPLTPQQSDYNPADSIRPSTRQGMLFLQLADSVAQAGTSTGQVQGPIDEGIATLPRRALPVTLSMMSRSASATALRSYAYVTGCVLFGGLLSLLAGSVLPMMLRKVAMRTQIQALANRTSSISTRVDSYLRVLLRLERKKIDVLLHATSFLAFIPAEVFDQVAAALERLTKRLVVAERLDDLRRCFEASSASAPPSVTDDLDVTLQAAANQLHAFALPDESVNAANKFLDKANASLDMLNDTSALAKLIAANFTNLQERLTQFPAAYYEDLKHALPGIFAFMDREYGVPKNITREMLFAIDHSIAAIHLALDYAILRESTPSGNSLYCDDAGHDARERSKAHECRLLALLGKMSWTALREARTLVQSMREDIYEQDVLDEITRPGQAEVVFDTQRARPYLPVYFSIAFNDRRFSGAAAIDCLVCTWDFPRELHEDGWKVCHYFDGSETPDDDGKLVIKVTVRSQQADGESHSIAGKIQLQSAAGTQFTSLFAGTLRFLIAFGVAVVGLLSGALEQLNKLDLLPATIAIIALGFGADSIKNILTQAPRKTTP